MTVTVQDLDGLLERYATEEAEKARLEEELKTKNKFLAGLKARIAEHLKETGRTAYDSPHGKCVVRQKWSVRMPEGEIAKRAFFDFLKERGIFESYATVNYNSLNSFYKKEWESAKERGSGLEFSLPGIGAPNLFEDVKISLYASKQKEDKNEESEYE